MWCATQIWAVDRSLKSACHADFGGNGFAETWFDVTKPHKMSHILAILSNWVERDTDVFRKKKRRTIPFEGVGLPPIEYSTP